ncbi:MAG: fibronectin type III domain-containing protein, partial [Bacteroidota bacterium]
APQVANRLQSLEVVFTGTGFISGATTVDMGSGIAVDSVVVNTTTQLTAAITVDSAAGVGVRDVRVLNVPPGGGSDTLANAFTVNNPGAILTSIDPDTARVGIAYVDIGVEGSSFVPESVVRFDTVGLQTVFVNTSRLTATIPGSELDTAGTFAVTVFTPGAGISNSKTFMVKNPAPTLASIDPDSVSRLQTLDIAISGSGFVEGFTSVEFNPPTDIPVNSVNVTSSSQLVANVTIGESAASGTRTLRVWNPVPGGGISDPLPFTIAGNPVPKLDSVKPALVSRLQILDVVVSGSGFVRGESWVDFGPDVTVNSTVVDTSFQITVNITVEVTAATGIRKIYVFTEAPGGGSSDSVDFEITNPAPELIALRPSNGNQEQSLDVTLDGRNFIEGVTSVDMGPGITIDSASVVNDTVLAASITITGSAALGPRDVRITNIPPGGGTDTLRNGFVVGNNPVPTIASIDPVAGDRLAIMDVRVRGTNFLGGVTTVDLGEGIVVRSTTVDSDTQLTASIRIESTAPTGPHDVLLANRPPGGGRDSIIGGFAVNNPAPSLVSISPSRGVLDQTLDLLLAGTKFIAGVTSVNMGPDITVNTTTIDSDTQLTVSVSIATSASTGARNVTVSNAAPGGGESDAVLFNVDLPGTTAPVLVSPQEGATGLPLTLVLLWNSQDGASAYHVQLSTDPVFGSTVFEDSLLTDTTAQVGPLNSGATYYWRVRARFTPGYGPYSDAQSFSTQAGYPQTYTLSTTITYPSRATASEYQPDDYRMIGLPGAGNLPMTSILGGTNNVDWQAYWDSGNPDESRGIVAYNGSADFTFSTGRAFWVVQKGPLAISTSVPTAELDSAGAVNIPLHTG